MWAINKIFFDGGNKQIMTIVRVSGWTMVSTMPLIGIFDNRDYKGVHYLFAFLFFTSLCVFSNVFARLLLDRHDITNHYWPVVVAKTIANVMAFVYILFVIFWAMKFESAALEWTIGLLSTNYILVLSYLNPFFEDIKKDTLNVKIDEY